MNLKIMAGNGRIFPTKIENIGDRHRVQPIIKNSMSISRTSPNKHRTVIQFITTDFKIRFKYCRIR